MILLGEGEEQYVKGSASDCSESPRGSSKSGIYEGKSYFILPTTTSGLIQQHFTVSSLHPAGLGTYGFSWILKTLYQLIRI